MKHKPMAADYCVNRLLVTGPARALAAFARGDRWTVAAGARGLDLLECPPRRRAWQFESPAPPLAWLRDVARQHPALVFVLAYDREARRCIGLAKACRGRVTHHRVRY